MTRKIPCGKELNFDANCGGLGPAYKCTKEDLCIECEAELIRLGWQAVAENDPTPADAEWLESVGLTKSSEPVRYWEAGGVIRIAVKRIQCFSDPRTADILYRPTRGAVLKILAGIGGVK